MGRPRGIALIINVKKFFKEGGQVGERKGSDKDVKELEELWKQLGFIVKCVSEKEYLKAHTICTILCKTAEKIDHDQQQNPNCFVCCIMSHGAGGSIYGSDWKHVDVKYIINRFKGDNCKALSGKPKLFFIQACRNDANPGGTKNEEVPCKAGANCVNMPATPSSEILESQEMNGGNSSKVNEDGDDDTYDLDPEEPHFLVGYSTARGR